MNSPLIGLIEIFRKLLDGADEKLIKSISDKKSKDVYISAPDIIITFLNATLILLNEQEYVGRETEIIDILNHVAIVPSIDWAITLYHKDYSFYKQPWMLRRLALHMPFKCKEDNFEKQVIYVNEFINPVNERVELN